MWQVFKWAGSDWCYKMWIRILVEGDALTSVMLFIGARGTELLWKLINLVSSYPCREEDVLDGISTGFYLKPKALTF